MGDPIKDYADMSKFSEDYGVFFQDFFTAEQYQEFRDTKILDRFGLGSDRLESEPYGAFTMLAMALSKKDIHHIHRMSKEKRQELGASILNFAKENSYTSKDRNGNLVDKEPNHERDLRVANAYYAGMEILAVTKPPMIELEELQKYGQAKADSEEPERNELQSNMQRLNTIQNVFMVYSNLIDDVSKNPRLMNDLGMDRILKVDQLSDNCTELLSFYQKALIGKGASKREQISLQRVLLDHVDELEEFQDVTFQAISDKGGLLPCQLLYSHQEYDDYLEETVAATNEEMNLSMLDNVPRKIMVANLAGGLQDARNTKLRNEIRRNLMKDSVHQYQVENNQMVTVSNHSYQNMEDFNKEHGRGIVFDANGVPHEAHYVQTLQDGDTFFIPADGNDKSALRQCTVEGSPGHRSVRMQNGLNQSNELKTVDCNVIKDVIDGMCEELKSVDPIYIRSSDEFRELKERLLNVQQEAKQLAENPSQAKRNEFFYKNLFDLESLADKYMAEKTRQGKTAEHSSLAKRRMAAVERCLKGICELKSSYMVDEKAKDMTNDRKAVHTLESYAYRLDKAHQNDFSKQVARAMQSVNEVAGGNTILPERQRNVAKDMATAIMTIGISQRQKDPTGSSAMREIKAALQSHESMDKITNYMQEALADDKKRELLSDQLKSEQGMLHLFSQALKHEQKEMEAAPKVQAPQKSAQEAKQDMLVPM